MAKKITLAEYKIAGIEDLISDTGDLIRQQEKLKESNKDLNKSRDVLTKSGERRVEVLAKNKAQLKQLSQEISVNTKVIQANVNINKELSTELDREVKSIDQARANTTALTKSRNALVTTDKNYKKNIELINAKIDENNKFVKENVSSLEKQKIGIGDYAGGVKEALASQTPLNTALNTMNQVFAAFKPLGKAFTSQLSNISDGFKRGTKNAKAMSGANKAMAISANIGTVAMRVLALAIAATGIGILLIAVGALFAAFKKIQPVMDRVNQIFAGIGAAVDVLIDRFANVGKILLNIFNQSLSDTLSDIKGEFAGIGDEMEREIALAIELERRTQKLRDTEISQIVIQAQRRKMIEENRIAAKDELKSLDERAGALILAQKLEQENLAEQLANAKELAAIAKGRLEQGLSDTDEIAAAEQKIADAIDLQTASIKKQRSVETELQSLQKRGRAQQLAASKKSIDQALKESKEKLNLFLQENEGRNKSLKESLDFEEQAKNKRLEILQQEFDAGKISRTKFETESLKIKHDFLAKQTNLTIENLNQELELWNSQNKSKLDSQVELTQLLVDEEIRRLQLINDKKLEILEEQRASGLISELEYLTAKQEQENAFIEEQKELKSDLAEEEKEIKEENDALAFEEELLNLEAKNEGRFAIELAQAERQKELDIINANASIKNEDNLQKALSNITTKHEQYKADITAMAQNQKLTGASQIAGGIAQIAGKESAVGKAAAIAQATINTFQGVTAALALTPPASYILAALTGASGLATVAKIAGVKGAEGAASGLSSVASGVQTINSAKLPKAEKGMLVGNNHANGGININAEHGEAILTSKSMSNPVLRNLASAINVAGGGVDFSTPNTTGIFADGGIVNRGITELSDTQELIQDSINSIRVVNVARDTTDVASDEIEVENLATI